MVEVRRNVENMMLAAYLKRKKCRVSDFFDLLCQVEFDISSNSGRSFFVLGGTIFHISPQQRTLIIGNFQRCPPNCHQILKKRIVQGLLLLPHGSVKNGCVSPRRLSFFHNYPGIFHFNHGRKGVPSLKLTFSTLKIKPVASDDSFPLVKL